MPKPISVCPAANVCELSQPQGPACGSIPEHLSQIALPGTLCTRALWQQYEEITNQAASLTSPGAFAIQQAGLLIELGIASAHNPAEADNFFANSKYHADLAANRMQNPASTYTTARLLSLFQPAYRAWGPHYWSTDPVKTELQIGISALMMLGNCLSTAKNFPLITLMTMTTPLALPQTIAKERLTWI